jgi:hypothetical protein
MAGMGEVVKNVQKMDLKAAPALLDTEKNLTSTTIVSTIQVSVVS